MSSEEELQDELKKLEIGIGLTTTKSSSENPFFQDVDNKMNNKSDEENTLKFFGDPQVKCGCRIRQTSESTLDLDSDISRLASTATSSSTIRTISKRSFKPKRKPVLREPIMKSIQHCFHHKSLRKSCPANLEPSTRDPQFFEALNLASITTTTTRNGTSQSHPLDFRDLCKELEYTTKPTDYLAHTRKSKNFNSIQTTDNRTKTIPKLRNCPSCSQQARINGSSGGGGGRNHSMDNNSSPSISNVSMVGGAGAVNNGASGDDVTIDELASYFETFVHIPKKMSSMAEMMYI